MDSLDNLLDRFVNDTHRMAVVCQSGQWDELEQLVHTRSTYETDLFELIQSGIELTEEQKGRCLEAQALSEYVFEAMQEQHRTLLQLIDESRMTDRIEKTYQAHD